MEQNDPIHPDEIILRRVREQHMTTDTARSPLPAAFEPDKEKDADGLSVYREKFHSSQDVAAFRTQGKNPSWVVKIRAGSIMQLGLTLRADPRPPEYGLPARPGHALIVEMNSPARKTDAVEQWKQQLLAAVIGVDGGYAGFAAPTTPAAVQQSR